MIMIETWSLIRLIFGAPALLAVIAGTITYLPNRIFVSARSAAVERVSERRAVSGP